MARGELAKLFLELDTGLDHCLRILLSCFRARTSADDRLTTAADAAVASVFRASIVRPRTSLQSGAATCWEGFVTCFLRVPQAAGLSCGCHAAQASNGNFETTYYEIFGTSCCPRLYCLPRLRRDPARRSLLRFLAALPRNRKRPELRGIFPSPLLMGMRSTDG